MRFAFGIIASLLALFVCLSPVSAFTNGTLLPAYICGPPTDGLPKSLGEYIPYMRLPTAAVGTRFTTPRLDYPADDGSVFNSQILLANWHDRNNTTPCTNVIFVTSVLKSNNKIANQIVPGQEHTLTLTINAHMNAAGIPICDTYTSATQVTADDIANIAVDGAVIYSINATGSRVGNFTKFGDPNQNPVTMQSFSACGPTGTGIVHNQLISCVGQYFGIEWVAPGNLVPGSTVTFKGAAVSDGGFGPHSSTLPIITPAAAGLSVTKATITSITQMAGDLQVFFQDNAKNAPAANAPILATSFVVTGTFGNNGANSVTATVTQSPAIIKISNAIEGQTLTFTVTSKNAEALPSVSDPFTFSVTTGSANKALDPSVLLSLCSSENVNQLTSFGMDPDPDNQCAYQMAVVANQTYAIDDASSTTTVTMTTSSSSSDLSMETVGIIIGSAVGGAVLMAAIIAGCIMWRRHKDSKDTRVGHMQREFAGVNQA